MHLQRLLPGEVEAFHITRLKPWLICPRYCAANSPRMTECKETLYVFAKADTMCDFPELHVRKHCVSFFSINYKSTCSGVTFEKYQWWYFAFFECQMKSLI